MRSTLVMLLCLAGALAPAEALSQLSLYKGSYDSDAQVYFNQLTINGCAVATAKFKLAVSNFVIAEKAAGNWGSQDGEYLLAVGDACTAGVNLAQPGLYGTTFTGGFTVSVAGGFTSTDGTAGGDMGATQASLKRQVQNSGHMEIYENAVATTRGMGTALTANSLINPGPGGAALRLNSATQISDSGASGISLSAIDRTNSTQVTTWRNGVVQTLNGSSNSVALATSDYLVCKVFGGVCPAGQSVYFWGFGAAMNDEASHYTNVRNLLLALGVTGI